MTIAASLEPADRQARLRAAVCAGAIGAWFAYTRLFPLLQAVHLVLPPCPFLALTGHPCPFCGGTRSFAALWRGQVDESFRLYPAGPLLFAGSILMAAGSAVGAATGRMPRTSISRSQVAALLAVAGVALAVNWALKLFWLGN